MSETERRYFRCPFCDQLGSVPLDVLDKALSETPFVRINCTNCQGRFPLDQPQAQVQADSLIEETAAASSNDDALLGDRNEPGADTANKDEAEETAEGNLPDWLSQPEPKDPIMPDDQPVQADIRDDIEDDSEADRQPNVEAIENAIAAMQAIEPPSDGAPSEATQPSVAPPAATTPAPQADDVPNEAPITEEPSPDDLVDESAALLNDMLGASDQPSATAEPEDMAEPDNTAEPNNMAASAMMEAQTEDLRPREAANAMATQSADKPPVDAPSLDGSGADAPHGLVSLAMLLAAAGFFIAGVMLLRG